MHYFVINGLIVILRFLVNRYPSVSRQWTSGISRHWTSADNGHQASGVSRQRTSDDNGYLQIMDIRVSI